MQREWHLLIGIPTVLLVLLFTQHKASQYEKTLTSLAAQVVQTNQLAEGITTRLTANASHIQQPQQYEETLATLTAQMTHTEQLLQAHVNLSQTLPVADAPCNWQCYLDNYADLQKAFGSNQSKAKSHYQTSGQKEGRNCRCDTSAVAVAAADSSGRHVWCVLLSATLDPFISLSNNSWSKHKNHDPAKRMAEYARSLELWANRTSMPIIFADNSGDAERLANITGGWKARLPKKRMQLVEVLNIPRSSVCGGKEIGCHEGHLVMTAVQQSQLVKSCTHVLKVTGRWFPHHIESVLGMCRRPELRLVVQNPRWRGDPDNPKSGWRQETQVLGFNKRFIHELFGWAESNGAACMECHIGSKVSAWRKNANINTICDMPPLLLDTKFSPREGSTGQLRNSLR